MESMIYIGIAGCQKKSKSKGANKRLNWLVVLTLILGCTLVSAKGNTTNAPVFSKRPIANFSKNIARGGTTIERRSGALPSRILSAKVSPVSNYYYTNTHIAIDVTNNLQGANVDGSNIGSVTVNSSAMPWPT